jgi:hypothetical protein
VPLRKTFIFSKIYWWPTIPIIEKDYEFLPIIGNYFNNIEINNCLLGVCFIARDILISQVLP